MRADATETGLYKKGNRYYALQTVPSEHRRMLKCTWYKKSLKTSDRRKAIRSLPSARAALQSQIESKVLEKLAPWLEAKEVADFEKALEAINIQAEIRTCDDGDVVVEGRFTRYDHPFYLRLTGLENATGGKIRQAAVCAIRDYLQEKSTLNRPTHIVLQGQTCRVKADVDDVTISLPQTQTGNDAAALADGMAAEARDETRRLSDPTFRLGSVVESYIKLHGVGAQYADESTMVARDFGAEKRVDEITDRDIIEYRDSLLDTRSPATVNKRLTVLKSALGHARDQGLVPTNVAAGVKRPKQGQASKEQKAETTRELNRQIIDLLPTHSGTPRTKKQRGDERRLAKLLIYTGLRIEDAAALDCSRVREHPDGFVYLEIRGGKSDANNRDIPLHPDIEQEVRAWCAERATGPLFPDLKHGAKYDKASTYADKNLNRFLKEKVKTDVRCHGLRHGFITMARNEGWTNAEKGRYVGHDTGSITDAYGSPHSLRYMRDKISTLSLVSTGQSTTSSS